MCASAANGHLLYILQHHHHHKLFCDITIVVVVAPEVNSRNVRENENIHPLHNGMIGREMMLFCNVVVEEKLLEQITRIFYSLLAISTHRPHCSFYLSEPCHIYIDSISMGVGVEEWGGWSTQRRSSFGPTAVYSETELHPILCCGVLFCFRVVSFLFSICFIF